MLEQHVGAEGVGVAYHPFLHDLILAEPEAFDFIELPLDLYSDPARAGLLDPSGARLRDIVAARPCVWRGSVLSLGSVEAIDDPAPDPRVIEQISQLMARVGTTQYSDVIGFRSIGRADLGLTQSLPYTETAAHWVAARYAAACAALGHEFQLQLCASGSGDRAAFLSRVAALAGCLLAVDIAEIDPDALQGERIATLVITGEHAADWASLAHLVDRSAARAIVIRRSRAFFPLDGIRHAAQRARELLERRVARPVAAPPVGNPAITGPVDLAALQEDQRAFIAYCLDPAPERIPAALAELPAETRAALAASVQSWHTWRQRLGDTHKAQQIAQFLAADGMRPGR